MRGSSASATSWAAAAWATSSPPASTASPTATRPSPSRPTSSEPSDGVFRLSVTEPMDEVAYLDHLRLDVIDRPPGVSTTPDERFAPTGPRPTGELLAWRRRSTPSARPT